MIKIIKPGKYHVVTCSVCKCEFSYEDEDIQWGAKKTLIREVECPCCGNRIDIYKTLESEEKDGKSD